jgi:Zn-dependent peptidase ImmA (M78 family)
MIKYKSALTGIDIKKLRKISKLTFEWCVQNMGKHPVYGLPKIICRENTKTDQRGYYDFDLGRHHIVIYIRGNDDIQNLIDTIIHEYKHSLQNMRKSYCKLERELGYWNHPMEKEARSTAKSLRYKCWNKIKHLI